MAEPVKIHFLWRPQLRNPSDEMVPEAAVNGRTDLPVTFNKPDYGTAPERFGIQDHTAEMAVIESSLSDSSLKERIALQC